MFFRTAPEYRPALNEYLVVGAKEYHLHPVHEYRKADEPDHGGYHEEKLAIQGAFCHNIMPPKTRMMTNIMRPIPVDQGESPKINRSSELRAKVRGPC